MKENNYCVYGHRNKINGKWYIGQTGYGDNPEKRWGKDGERYAAYFGHAIKKYGWNNFEHIILKENLIKKEADWWEKYYIKHYNSKENGYNLTEGGEGVAGFIFSEEARKKISEANKNRSEETRKKMSEALKGEKHPNAKKVICIETNEIFSYGKECAEKMNINYSSLVMCCQGRRKAAGGYHFKYYED